MAVSIVDKNGKIIACNPRASRLYSSPEDRLALSELNAWQPRSGKLTELLRSVAGSSSWVPIALNRGEKRIELKGRALMVDGRAEPHILLMESPSAPLRFAEHSEQVRRLNAQLIVQQKTEERLRAAIQVAEDLRREVVHRVKNNLAIVAALLRTKSRTAEHPAATEALLLAATRVHSIAIIHDILDARNETETVTTKAVLMALLDHLQDAICPAHITLACDVLDIEILAETALPICLLVNELVTNAIKHAFRGRNSGEIRVVFKHEKEGFVLVVADNGVWVDEVPQRKGKGSQIVLALAQQLNGQLTVTYSEGTTWTISLPLAIKRTTPSPPFMFSNNQRDRLERP
ncbi:sensor histidine kinase [Maritalea mediterranea]|uniref:histidine kinase n=1 Tax=Maritalea mediterranea TaxID=2909667 RepID=A0ABS9E5U2_9HYPH|nr:histidine kinase dimerization/phosphoacceptor domain -containing protein [Maritalea mediterranea]MCF4097582.1 ATP-binding protein [Maritalea mediterranea]